MYPQIFHLPLFFLVIHHAQAVETPIIGILTQENYLFIKSYPDAHSFLAASYVKLLESSGAQVIPIWIGQDKTYYEKIVQYTNGVVFPGGGTYFNETGGFGEAAKQIYELAVQVNKGGEYYPIWGVCLGMQAMMFAAADGEDIRGDCDSKNVALPLNFVKGFEKSKLLSPAPPFVLENLNTKNITFNYHRYCIFEKDLKSHDLLRNWTIISTNRDKNGLEFVSTMESIEHPFYGTQYHPEKNSFEFKQKSVSHSVEAIGAAQYFANFFISECRKSGHTFPSAEIRKQSLIYNYNPVFTETKTSYEQLYFFRKEDYGNGVAMLFQPANV